MKNNVTISTEAIDSLAYHGLYETYIGEYYGCVQYDKRNALDIEIANRYLEYFTEMFNSVLDCDGSFEVKYSHTYHPAYYNFETDAIVFNLEYDDKVRDFFNDYACENRELFDKFLHDNYTSCSGFISLTPNNFEEWKNELLNENWRCVAAFIRFIFDNEFSKADKSYYNISFEEEIVNIIEEYYISYECAEKLDNGYIIVVRGEYDDDTYTTIYHGVLLDTDKNVVNTCDVSDGDDIWFHGSAWAVMAFSYMASEITKNYSLGCDTHAVMCDIPDFEE